MAKLEFEKWIESILKIMKKSESYIGMTLAEAVEKQIPKAPLDEHISIGSINPIDFDISVCPICGKQVTSYYRQDCGQKIDWEAVDDE